MSKEYTFAMLRPGALRRKKVRYIFDYIKAHGLNIEKYEMKELTPDVLQEHYKHLICDEIPYDVFERTMKENLSGLVICMIVSGNNAVSKMREIIGPSNVKRTIEEFPNTLRALGDPNNNPDNLIHASDSIENAKIEIERFFGINIKDCYTRNNELMVIETKSATKR